MANLCGKYGSRYQDVIQAGEKKVHLSRICEQFPDVWAEILHAVRNEMAISLSDVLFRRTGLCTLGNPGDDVIERVAELVAKELKWKKAKGIAEMDRVLDTFSVKGEAST